MKTKINKTGFKKGGMAKGSFGLVKGEDVKDSDIRRQLRNLRFRKSQLVKEGEFTPERKSYFNEIESELKRALRI